jgi:hypothetical protein
MLYSQWFVLQQLTLPSSLGFHSGCFAAIGHWPPSGRCFDVECFMAALQMLCRSGRLLRWGMLLSPLLLDACFSSLVGFPVTRALSSL